MASHNTFKSAFRKQDFKKVNRLLDVVSSSSHSDYPLVCELAFYNQKELLEKAVEKGWSVHVCDEKGYYPIHLAVVESGDIELVKQLVCHGADVNQKSKGVSSSVKTQESSYWRAYPGVTPPLLMIGEMGDGPWLPMVDALVSLGADIHGKNSHEDTILHQLGYALREGRMIEDARLVMEYVLAKGMDVNIQNNIGQTPLMHFVGSEVYYPYAELLIDHGANLFAQDNHDSTVFDYFADISSFESPIWKNWEERSDVFYHKAALEKELPLSHSTPPSRRL